MGTKFGGSYPGAGGGRKREQLMFVAAAGLAFSLLIILLVVFNFRKAEANVDQEMPVEMASTMVGTVTLYSADTYIKAGSNLQDFQFREVYWPRSSVPDGSVLDLREMQGQFARVDIPVGVPVQRTHLTGQRAVSTSLPITPGMRAVTIQVDAESGIEGFAKPGVRVDIVLTYMKEGDDLTSKVIVQNARILSKGGETQKEDSPDQQGRRSKVAPTVTLEVSPSDALSVTTSKQLGSLSLFMRASEDEKAAPVLEVSQTQIDGGIKKDTKTRNCNRGVMRIEGKEFMIDCDGSISQMDDSLDP